MIPRSPPGAVRTLARLSEDGGAVQQGGSLTDGRTIEPITAHGDVEGFAEPSEVARSARASQRNCDQELNEASLAFIGQPAEGL